jgi:hypothetical protein
MFNNAANRPFARAAALILLELDRVSSNPTTAVTNRRQLLACLNHELRGHGLWVTYDPEAHRLTYHYADAGAETFRERRDGEAALPHMTLSQDEIQQARQKARLVHTGISRLLQDWERVPNADRAGRLAEYQANLRTAFQTAVGSFLSGDQGAIRWETLRQELNNSLRLQRVEIDRVGNDQDGYTLVFYRLTNSFARGEELIRVPGVRVVPGDGAVAAGPQPPDPRFARIANDISGLLRVFEDNALGAFFREEFGPQGNREFIERWCGPANSNDPLEVFVARRAAAAQRLNLAFEDAHIPFRVSPPRQVDETDKRFGWELDIQRQIDGNWVTIGTGRPRDGQFRLTPDLRFITREEFQREIAETVLAYVRNNYEISRDEQFALCLAFRLFSQISQHEPGREQEVNTARERFCEAINTRFLHQDNIRIAYVANHNGQPALRVIRPNEEDRFIPLVEPGPSEVRQAGQDLGRYLAYAGVGFVSGGLGVQFGRWAANGVDFARGVVRGLRGQGSASDTQYAGARGAELTPMTTRLADAPVYIEHAGHRDAMSPQELREFAERSIREQMRLNDEALARLRGQPASRTTEAEIRRLELEQSRLREAPASAAEFTFRPGRTPGGRSISRITVRGVIISTVAIATVLASWYALSRVYHPPNVLPFR